MKAALVLLAAFAGAGFGAEHGPYTVIFIPDAATLTVQSPGEDEPERIGLRWIAPPPGDPAAAQSLASLRALLPSGMVIKLVTPEAEAPRDRRGRLIGLVVMTDGGSVQEAHLRGGWCTLVPDETLAEDARKRLAAAQDAARQAKAGAWAQGAASIGGPAPAAGK